MLLSMENACQPREAAQALRSKRLGPETPHFLGEYGYGDPCSPRQLRALPFRGSFRRQELTGSRVCFFHIYLNLHFDDTPVRLRQRIDFGIVVAPQRRVGPS